MTQVSLVDKRNNNVFKLGNILSRSKTKDNMYIHMTKTYDLIFEYGYELHIPKELMDEIIKLTSEYKLDRFQELKSKKARLEGYIKKYTLNNEYIEELKEVKEQIKSLTVQL